jgi:hypothetical protein
LAAADADEWAGYSELGAGTAWLATVHAEGWACKGVIQTSEVLETSEV